MKYTICLFVLITFFSCQNKPNEEGQKVVLKYADSTLAGKSTDSNKVSAYPYDTVLKGGYSLSYRRYVDSTGEKLQGLMLKKGSKDIYEVGQTSDGLPYKSLGYKGADFDKYFVLVQSFGSGNPHVIQFIDKATGETLRYGTWVDADEHGQVLLYFKDQSEPTEELILFDVTKNKARVIKDFNNAECAKAIQGLSNCVKIDTVTATQIVLKIDNKEEKIVKTYSR